MARPKGVSTGKERLIEAAGRTFRVGGFGGAGIDAVASEAGLTSGAFYAHFGSKANAFALAVEDGLEALHAALKAHQAAHGGDWLEPFVDFYLCDRLAVDLSQACALPTFTADVIRADDATRQGYSVKLAAIVETAAQALGGDRARAWRLLAMLSGAAGMARAVSDNALREQLVDAARAAAKAI